MRELAAFDTADGLYDCCWSEARPSIAAASYSFHVHRLRRFDSQENENILVSASGDGSIKVWDLSAPPGANPLRSLEEHTHEVYCVTWQLGGRRDGLLSASWDDTVKLWCVRRTPAAGAQRRGR